ncbi:MAG: cyclic nucleotide-binding domain-containing protein [Acidimicrobiales bacterium]
MARQDSRLDHLSNMWLFSGCSRKELSLIARASDEVQVPAGRVLCDEGRVGQQFFLIINGQAVVKRKGRKIAMLGPGQYFGEQALLDRMPRSASVASHTDMDLLVLGQREFNGVIEQIPSLARKMLSAMSMRLRGADPKVYT